MGILLNLGHGAGVPGITLAFLTRPPTALTDAYMGVSPDAEMEEIKSAYRRLSQQYHPDTASLPLKIAAQKFMRLKKHVLSASPAVGVKPPYQVKHLSLSARK